jgi:energy-coupling factor transport system permease protein
MQMSLYLTGDSLLHRFDPRAKMLSVLFFSVYAFLPVGLPWLISVYGMLLLVSFIMLGIREAFSPIRSIYPILIMIALFTPPFYRDDPIGTTAMLLLRITIVTTLFFLLFGTTRMSDVLATLRWFGLPYQASLVVTIAFRYIPYLNGTYHQVRDAHKLRRGGGEHTGGFFTRLGQIQPILVSVMVFAVKSIPLLAMSLEHRGFGHEKVRRKGYKSLRNNRKLFTHLIISVIITGIFTTGPCLF